MTDSTANPTDTFRFFDLPAELRDMIYDEVWRTTPKLGKDAKLNDGTSNSLRLVVARRDVTSLSNNQSARNTLPLWVQINKTFLREALSQFYCHCKWVACTPGTHATTVFMLSDDQRTEKMLRYIRVHLRRAPNEKWRTELQETSNMRIGIGELPHWPTGLSLLKKLESGLLHEGAKTLNISFGIVLELCIGTEEVVDLGEFQETGFELDRLIVDVLSIDEEQYKDRADRLYPLLKTEVVRLGCVLVGESSRLSGSTKQVIGKQKVYEYWHFKVTKV